jgi:hypothetical protein
VAAAVVVDPSAVGLVVPLLRLPRGPGDEAIGGAIRADQRKASSADDKLSDLVRVRRASRLANADRQHRRRPA